MSDKPEVHREQLNNAWLDLHGLGGLAHVSVTEWSNGEGWDVEISGDGDTQRFTLTSQELTAIQVLIGSLDLWAMS